MQSRQENHLARERVRERLNIIDPRVKKLIEIVEEILSDDDDEDMEDDGEEEVPGHDPESEPLPNLPMYHPSVKEVESLSSQIMSEFQFFLESSEYRDRETEYLLEESKILEHPPHESHVLRLGLVGDAGQGKSSVLNSITGKENMAIHVSSHSFSSLDIN
jgi:predicted GTPase